MIDVEEYESGELPAPGTQIQAEFVRWDPSRELCVLTTRAVRREVAWDELREGLALEGTVVGTNKGGLTLDIKGMRAFMPISQIDRQRVEELEPWVGRTLSCEVMRVDRANQDLVVSRRVLLDREAEEARERILETLAVGDVRSGKVVRVNQFGAFIDIGGVDGLIHDSRLIKEFRSRDEHPKPGDHLEVEITNIDLERGRVGLDFVAMDSGSWEVIVQEYAVGDEVAGWISRHEDGAAVLAVDGGLEVRIPISESSEALDPGAILSARISSIDAARKIVSGQVI